MGLLIVTLAEFDSKRILLLVSIWQKATGKNAVAAFWLTVSNGPNLCTTIQAWTCVLVKNFFICSCGTRHYNNRHIHYCSADIMLISQFCTTQNLSLEYATVSSRGKPYGLATTDTQDDWHKTPAKFCSVLLHILRVNSPKYDEVHAGFALIVVFNETLLSDFIHRLDRRYFLVHAFIRVQVRIHEITKHQLAKITFSQLHTQWMSANRLKLNAKKLSWCGLAPDTASQIFSATTTWVWHLEWTLLRLRTWYGCLVCSSYQISCSRNKLQSSAPSVSFSCISCDVWGIHSTMIVRPH